MQLNNSTLGSSEFSKRGQMLFEKPFLLFEIGDKKFSLIFNFFLYSFLMALLKERTIARKL